MMQTSQESFPWTIKMTLFSSRAMMVFFSGKKIVYFFICCFYFFFLFLSEKNTFVFYFNIVLLAFLFIYNLFFPQKIYSKIINCAVPGTIDPRAINVRKGGKDINVFQAKENLRLAIASATSIGCIIINITPPLIMDARKHIILGVLWQILRVGKI